MSSACECDRCEVLFRHERGTVSCEYTVATDNAGSGLSYSNDGEGLDLCPKCSKEFLSFMKHEYDAKEKPKAGG